MCLVRREAVHSGHVQIAKTQIRLLCTYSRPCYPLTGLLNTVAYNAQQNPLGSDLRHFPFRDDPFSERRQNKFERVVSHESTSSL